VRRISTFEILKHKFFDGPARMLVVPKRRLSVDGSSIEEETYRNENILPPKIAVPKRRLGLEHLDPSEPESLEERGSEEVKRTSRAGSGGHRVGLETLLEEIGVSDDYPRRRISLEIPDDNRRRNSRESAEGHIPGRLSAEIRRCDRRISGNRQRHSSVETVDNFHRESETRDESLDSYSRRKEAVYDQHHPERDGRKHDQPRYPEEMGKPSPGEGLRNALGNLETRLKNRAFGNSRQSSMNQQREDPRRASGRKGFATMVEELVKPRRRDEKGISIAQADMRKRRRST
jgi:hypothetical protein